MARDVPFSSVLGLVSLLLVLFAGAGCGASRESASEASYAQGASAPAAQAPGAPPPPPSPALESDYGYEFDDAFPRSIDLGPEAKPVVGKAPHKPAPKQARPPVPLVVYSGYLKLQVRRVLDTIDELTKATEARGGYIESLTSDVVVVRVPGDDFESVMEHFAELGEVLDQSVRAEDVTAQFTDIGARLAVAREARSRLMALLEQEKDMKQRLAVLQEIKRLTEQIELMESTLATLQNLVDYFTITIELVPVLEHSRTAVYVSPFPWIRELNPHRATLRGGKDDFTLTPPKGFVVFEDDEEFRAQSADTATLRAATLDNEPRGDAVFWTEAVRHELLARGEKSVARGTKGVVSYEIFVNDDVKPRYYLVGIAVREADLFVVEGFFPNQASHDTHVAALTAALATFRPD